MKRVTSGAPSYRVPMSRESIPIRRGMKPRRGGRLGIAAGRFLGIVSAVNPRRFLAPLV